MATPTSARARAGASLIPSPVMMTAARRCSRRTASSLASGVSSASTSSTPVSAPTALAASARSPVASTIRVMPPRRSARIVCRASGRIRSSSRSAPAGVPSTATNTVSAPSSQARRRTALTHGGVPLTPAQSARPSLTRRPATVPAMPWPGCSVTSAGWPSGQPRSAAARTTAACQDVPGGLVERGGQAQDLFRGQRPGGHDGGHGGLACGERPGLVQQHGGAPGQALEHPAVLHHDPAARRRRQAGDQGDRRGQDERAGRGDDQDGHRAGRAAQRPRHPGHGQAQRQEPQGVPVGEPDERRLRVLRLADQADDAGVGAVRRAGRGPQVERPGRVDGAAAQRVTPGVLDRQRLPGERGFIQHGGIGGQRAVHGDDVARRDEQQVTGHDLVQGHGLQRSVPVAPGGARRPGQQGAQVVPRAGRPPSPPGRARWPA